MNHQPTPESIAHTLEKVRQEQDRKARMALWYDEWDGNPPDPPLLAWVKRVLGWFGR